MIGLQDLIDRLVSGNLINSRAWDDIEVIAGSVLIRDWPVEDCLRLTDYILADRETVRVAGRFCNRVNRTALVEGHTWGMFPRPIPFFVGPAEREVHFPAEEAPEPTQSRTALDRSFDQWTHDDINAMRWPDR